MQEVLEMLVVFGAIALVVKLLTDFSLRKKLIEKGLVDEKVKYLFADAGVTHLLSNIRWGLIMVAIGVALFWKQVSPYYIEDTTVFGLMFLLAGIGFVVYYFIAKSHIEKRRKDNGQI